VHQLVIKRVHPKPSSFLKVSDQVSHPYKTTGKIIVLYITIFKFLGSKLEGKDSATNDSKDSLTLIFPSRILTEIPAILLFSDSPCRQIPG